VNQEESEQNEVDRTEKKFSVIIITKCTVSKVPGINGETEHFSREEHIKHSSKVPLKFLLILAYLSVVRVSHVN